MGLLDFANKVLTTYEARVDGYVRELGRLQGAEAERTKGLLEGHRQTSAALGKYKEELTQLTSEIGVAVKVAQVAWDGFKLSAEHARLEAAAGSTDIAGLQRATLGLRKEMDLLRDAAAFQTGAFKLSQSQMELVERAMLSLTRQGGDATQVHNKLLQAVTNLKTDGLQDLGIFVDKAGLSMDKAGDRAKLFERVLAALGETAAGVKDGQRTAAEQVEATAVTFEDAFDKMKMALGELVKALAPLLDSLAETVSIIGKVASALSESGLGELLGKAFKISGYILPGPQQLAALYRGGKDVLGFNDSALLPGIQSTIAGKDTATNRAAFEVASQFNDILSGGQSRATGEVFDPWNLGATSGDLRYTAVADLIRRFGPGAARFFAPPPTGGEGGYTIGGYDYLTHARDTTGIPPGAYVLGASAGALGDKYGPGGELAPQGIYDAGFASSDPGFLIREAEKLRTQGQQKSLLEGIFGPVGEFHAYAKAFETLTGAVSSALGAWIDGSMSAGEAFKKFIGEAIKGLAQQMLVEAVKHGAYALGSLAFGDVAGASRHAAAAAAFGAGAAVAAVAARELGHGGGDYGKPAGGAGAGAGGSGGGGRGGGAGGDGDGGRDVIIAYADPFADDSPRARQLQAQRLVGRVLGSSGVKYQ